MAVGGGIGTIILVLVLLVLGVDPQALLQQLPPPGAGGGGGGGNAQVPLDPAQEEQKEFVGVVLADTEDVWNELFASQLGQPYQEPELVLFTEAVRSGCGFAGAAVGPFYCPADAKVYLDLSFFQELSDRFGAEGDFARAYVVAHEIGHHVQNLLGISGEVSRRQQAARSEEEANRWSVRLELQADFLAGVWAHHADRMKDILEPGDLAEALQAANAIGDDTLQRQTQGQVVPDSFTHGSSEQRVRWFRLGYETGDLEQLDAPLNAPYNQL
jgi:predicted metalloprotease